MTKNNNNPLATIQAVEAKLSLPNLDNNKVTKELIRQLFEEIGLINKELVTRSKENIKIDNKL